jgi:hypothetical protein
MCAALYICIAIYIERNNYKHVCRQNGANDLGVNISVNASDYCSASKKYPGGIRTHDQKVRFIPRGRASGAFNYTFLIKFKIPFYIRQLIWRTKLSHVHVVHTYIGRYRLKQYFYLKFTYSYIILIHCISSMFYFTRPRRKI